MAGKNYNASRGGGVDGLTSAHMDPLLYLTTNGSHPTLYSVKDETQQSGSMVNYIAEHRMATQTYYGIVASSDIYGFSIGQDARTGIFVQIANFGDGPLIVYPELYGDSKTHFNVYWTRDGYQKTGCYNLKCPGYVPEANVPIVPGITIGSLSEPGGVKHVVRLAGFAVTRTTNLVPMGSGFLPNNTKAASFTDIQLIDQNGVTSKVQQDQPVVIVDKKVYSVSPISAEGKFTYAGPLE
ncbi:hypothetical protein EJB05_56914, partial [Eragrostis curvula]